LIRTSRQPELSLLSAATKGVRRKYYTASVHVNHFSYDGMLRRYMVEDSSGVRDPATADA
jgi:hypothetical protein